MVGRGTARSQGNELDYSQVCSGGEVSVLVRVVDVRKKSGFYWMEAVLGADLFALEV